MGKLIRTLLFLLYWIIGWREPLIFQTTCGNHDNIIMLGASPDTAAGSNHVSDAKCF